jgi:hypothetical protein
MKRTLKKIEPSNSNLDKFLSGLTTFSERYPHLQIFLHREGSNNCELNDEYLMICQNSFGKIIVRDLTFEDPHINITIQDCSTQKVGIVQIDIHDVNPKVFFICWQDIKYMWREERKCIMADLNNLEFEF